MIKEERQKDVENWFLKLSCDIGPSTNENPEQYYWYQNWETNIIYYEQKNSKPLIFIVIFRNIDTAIWMHYMDANKTAGEETRWQLHKNAASNPEQVLAATPHKTPTVRPPTPYHENYSS